MVPPTMIHDRPEFWYQAEPCLSCVRASYSCSCVLRDRLESSTAAVARASLVDLRLGRTQTVARQGVATPASRDSYSTISDEHSNISETHWSTGERVALRFVWRPQLSPALSLATRSRSRVPAYNHSHPHAQDAPPDTQGRSLPCGCSFFFAARPSHIRWAPAYSTITL
jgi:hypothetical protein